MLGSPPAGARVVGHRDAFFTDVVPLRAEPGREAARSSATQYTRSRFRAMSAETTTVKVRTGTRDLLRSIGAARPQSADQVILSALAAMQRDERRQLAAAEARAIAADPSDLAEIRAIRADLAALHEG